MLLEAQQISLSYKDGRDTLHVLQDVQVQFPATGFFGILGPSGSGKTSLLYILSGIRRPTHGSVCFDGQELPAASGARNKLRRAHMGFVFQLHFLMNYLTVEENIRVGLHGKDDHAVGELIERLGLAGLEKHFPYQLSGGQRQRVAIARAAANTSKVLFVDEPTASLDQENAAKVVSLLHDMSKQACVIVVTHDPAILTQADEVLRLQGGVLTNTKAAA